MLDCVTSPGYHLHFTERVHRALTPLETLPHRSSLWSFGRHGVRRFGAEKAESRLFKKKLNSEKWAPIQKGTWAPESIVRCQQEGNHFL